MPGIGLGLGVGIGSSKRRLLGGAAWAFTNMALEGDSHTAGAFYYSGGWLALRSWTAASDGDPATVTAVGGSGMTDVENRLASVVALNPSLVTLHIGANDLYAQTAAAYYSRIIAYFNSVRASVPRCKFALSEQLPLDPNAAANSPPTKATHNAKRAAFAILARAGVGTDFDILIPFGSAPLFTDAAGANTALFSDGLHPDGGACGTVLVAVFEAAIGQAIANNFSGTTPTLTINNVTGAALSTDYIVDFMVTGLGAGRSVTFSKTSGSGTIARGNQDVGTAFGTSSLQMMNGDYGRVKITSSAAADTPVTMDINVGGVARTVSVRTAALPANTMVMNASDQNASLSLSNGGLTVSQATDPQDYKVVRSNFALVPTTAAGATTNAAGYAVGATVITLASAGTGAIPTSGVIKFAGDSHPYYIASGDADVSNGGTITLAAPGLRQAIPASATAITAVNKFYAEMTCNSRQGVYFPQFGVCNGAASLSAMPGKSNSNGGGKDEFGAILPGGTYNIAALSPGDRCNLAVDIAAHKIWMGVNGTYASTTDPAAGTNGNDVSALAQFYLFVSLMRIDSVTVNTGGSAFTDAVPTGFSALP